VPPLHNTTLLKYEQPPRYVLRAQTREVVARTEAARVVEPAAVLALEVQVRRGVRQSLVVVQRQDPDVPWPLCGGGRAPRARAARRRTRGYPSRAWRRRAARRPRASVARARTRSAAARRAVTLVLLSRAPIRTRHVVSKHTSQTKSRSAPPPSAASSAPPPAPPSPPGPGARSTLRMRGGALTTNGASESASRVGGRGDTVTRGGRDAPHPVTQSSSP
jgi:hypothetical protein